jgi:uncharacterized membrane protein YqhA
MARIIEHSKYLVVVAVFALLAAAAAAFGWGALKTYGVVSLIITSAGEDAAITVELIRLMDAFLIATALLIFAASLYELFLGELKLPEWMLAHNLHELKAKLSSIVVLVMAVKFLERLAEWQDAPGTVLYALAVAAVSAVLIALSRLGGKD